MRFLREANTRLRLIKNGVSIRRDGSIYVLLQRNGKKWYFARFERLHRYAKGIERITTKVARSYLLHEIDLKEETVFVIDVGCNVGEFTYSVQRRFPKTKALLIDAEQLEVECAMRNLSKSEHEDKKSHEIVAVNAALWTTFGCQEFFMDNETGDSSFFRSPTSRVSLFKSTIGLDELWKQLHHPFPRIDILKMDVEGAEPEVLRGATEVLKITKYLLIDAGPERGMQRETTIDEVNDIVSNLNFELVKQSDIRHGYYFRNTSIDGF